MIVLGVDTSLRSTGYGVLETFGSSMRAVEFGVIRNARDVSLTGCLRNIHSTISNVIVKCRPDVVAVESVIYGKNAGTMLLLGHARGAVLVAAADQGVPVYEYEPRRMKMAVCGNGMADKIQIQRMIKMQLSLAELPQNDVADALGMAIAHVHANQMLSARNML